MVKQQTSVKKCDINVLDIPWLKGLLRARALPVSGTKAVLLTRLKKHGYSTMMSLALWSAPADAGTVFKKKGKKANATVTIGELSDFAEHAGLFYAIPKMEKT